LNLANVDREQAAGSFSIDLVAEDENGGTVIIENQLGKSDHDHLGKLITYATGLDAKAAAIWIISDPRPEHVAAVTWLNEAGSVSL
jgi:RecB family endonuclease NucS